MHLSLGSAIACSRHVQSPGVQALAADWFLHVPMLSRTIASWLLVMAFLLLALFSRTDKGT